MRSAIRSRLIDHEQQLVEFRLVETLAMSRNAVRTALQRLAAEGLVARSTRTGTTVVPEAIMRLAAVEPWPVNRRDVAAAPMVCELERRVVPASTPLSERLDVPFGTDLLMVEQLVSADRPLALRVGYRQLDAGEPPPHLVEPAVPGSSTSLETAFAHLRGRRLGKLTSAVEAIAADARTSQLLDVPEDSPLLLRESLTHLADDSPYELAFTWHPGARVSINFSGTAL